VPSPTDANERRRGTCASRSNGNGWGCVPLFHPRRCKAARLYPLSFPTVKSMPPSETYSRRQRRARLGRESNNPGPQRAPVCFYFALTRRSRTDPHSSLAMSMACSDNASGL